MATDWRGEIIQVVLARTEGQRRVYRVHLLFYLFDDAAPAIRLATIPMEIPYPAPAFHGLTKPQALQLILDTGVGEIPSLRMIGSTLVDDYDNGAVLRALPANYEFGP